MPNSRLQLLHSAVDRFAEACRRDRDVTAAFLGGSLADGTADDQSDLDLYLITPKSGYDDFFARGHDFIRSWGKPVELVNHLNFENLGFDMILFTFEDTVDGELAVAHEDNFRKTHGGPHQVLVDKTGFLDGISFPKGEFAPQPPDAAAINLTLTWFPRQLRIALKSCHRGNLTLSVSALSGLRSQCLTLARRAGIPDEEAEAVMSPTFTRLDRAEIEPALLTVMDCFEKWGPEAARLAGVDFPKSLSDVTRQRLESAVRNKTDS